MKSGDQQAVDYLLVNLMSSNQTKPNWQKALFYRKLSSTVGTQKSAHKNKLSWKLDTQEFKKYGTGVYLYFRLLQMLAYTFIILTVISLPAFLSNYKGDGLNIYGQDSILKSLMKLSLGNQHYEEYNNIVEHAQIAKNIEISQNIIEYTDLLCSLIFMCFLIYWKVISDQSIEELITEDALPSYYTLKVRRIPGILNYSQELMKQHFEKFGGKIAQISTVYDYDMILAEMKDLILLIDEFSACSHQHKRQIYSKISIKVSYIFQLFKQKPMKPMVCLITFEDMEMRNKIRDLYKYEVGPSDLQIQGRIPIVTGCKEQPSSIIWENYHLSAGIEFRQGLCIFTILFVVLLLALLDLFLANARATSVIEHQINFTREINYTKDYTFSEAKENGTIQVIFNYCSKLDYRSLTLKYSEFCKPYFNSYKQRFKGMLLLSLLVIVVNLILNWIIYELANYRRYKTKTQKSRFLILNIFILYFINTGLLLMLIRLQIGDFSLGRLVSKFIQLPSDQFSIQSFSDFTRKWYLHIGVQIVTVYAVSLLVSPFIQIVAQWIQMKVKMFRAKRATTQKQMNELIIGSQFDFQTFYAMLLNACFVTMFYANAIPILYLLAVGAFISLYIASFIVFKYFCCKPVMFDHALNKVISKVLCVSLFLHQITSIMFFYTEDIFPLHVLSTGHSISFWHKFEQGLGFTIFSLFLLLLTLNYSMVCKVARRFYRRVFKGQDQEIIRSRKKNLKLFSQIFHRNKIKMTNNIETAYHSYLSSYRMEENPLYVDIWYALSILNTFQPYFVSTKDLYSSSILPPHNVKISLTFEDNQNLISDRPML